MVKLIFKPSGVEVEVNENTKILVACIQNKIQIIYGCGACRCGTCGVRVSGEKLKEMAIEEFELLQRRGYPTDGTIRLACQARIIEGEVTVDIGFQSE